MPGHHEEIISISAHFAFSYLKSHLCLTMNFEYAKIIKIKTSVSEATATTSSDEKAACNTICVCAPL